MTQPKPQPARSPKQKRGTDAYRKGQWAEKIAQLYLICKGYRCLAHRHRTPVGEIDLLCRKSGQLIVVEVKSGRHILARHDSPIPNRQQKRLINAAQYLYARQAEEFPNGLRLDAVLIDSATWRLRHHRNISL